MRRKDWKIDKPLLCIRRALAQLEYLPHRLASYCRYYLPPELSSQVETAARSFDAIRDTLWTEVERRQMAGGTSHISQGRVELVKREVNWYRRCQRCNRPFAGARDYTSGKDTREPRYMVASKRRRKAGVQPRTVAWCEACAREVGLVW